MSEPWHIITVIPARNEELLLPRCLNSVLRASRALPSDVTWDIVVASDRSVDRTYEQAAQILGTSGSVVSTAAGVVGAARCLAASFALDQYGGPLKRCWLANTDADCVVPRNWLLHQLELARSGAAAVAGIVDVDSFAEHQAIVRERFRSSYLLHDDGTHPHVHGANLGVRADAYLNVGGWSYAATAEDHDLWKRLTLAGYPTLSDSKLKVLTSGRKVGRAPMGFAAALAAHNIIEHEVTSI